MNNADGMRRTTERAGRAIRHQPAAVLFIGKRFYTNRDALTERFGRIYQIPFHWAQTGLPTRLWLIDYYTRESGELIDEALTVDFTPLRSLSIASHALRECGRLLWPSSRYEIVVASGDCYVGLLGYLIARFNRALFVFDVYDKYDEFVTYRRLGPFDPFRFLLKRSGAVTFASRALSNEIGWQSRNSFIAPNGIDSRTFRPMDKRESRRKLDLPPDRLFIGYFGSMEACRGIGDLIAAMEIVRRSRPDVELVLAGPPVGDVDLEPEWIRYLGNLSFERVPAALAACDILAIPYRRSAFLDMASSCKIAEYIAAQRPIVATRTPNLVENFPQQAQELGGLLAEPGNADQIADSIHKQLAEPRLVSMPDHMEWASIAAGMRQFVQLSGRPGMST